MDNAKTRQALYIESSKMDIESFPKDIQEVFLFGIDLACQGKRAAIAKSLKGFGGASVLELVEDDRSGTYRAVYTVRYKEAVYVLHAFQKKSKKGIATPKPEINKVKERLKAAEAHHKETFNSKDRPWKKVKRKN